MFAVIKTGGKQYKVARNDVVVVERLAGEAGDTIQIDDVLMVGEAGKAPTVGTPMIDGAAVTAELVEQTRGKKIIVFKKKRRQNYRRKNGHRQDLTVLRVTEIIAKGATKQAPKPKAAKAKPAAEKAEAKPAAKKTAAAKAPAKKPAAKTETKAKTAAKKPAAKKAPAKKPAAKTKE